MELFKDLNWLLVLAFFVMGNSPLIFIDRPIKDRRWLVVVIGFNLLALGSLIYFIAK